MANAIGDGYGIKEDDENEPKFGTCKKTNRPYVKNPEIRKNDKNT